MLLNENDGFLNEAVRHELLNEGRSNNISLNKQVCEVLSDVFADFRFTEASHVFKVSALPKCGIYFCDDTIRELLDYLITCNDQLTDDMKLVARAKQP